MMTEVGLPWRRNWDHYKPARGGNGHVGKEEIADLPDDHPMLRHAVRDARRPWHTPLEKARLFPVEYAESISFLNNGPSLYDVVDTHDLTRERVDLLEEGLRTMRQSKHRKENATTCLRRIADWVVVLLDKYTFAAHEGMRDWWSTRQEDCWAVVADFLSWLSEEDRTQLSLKVYRAARDAALTLDRGQGTHSGWLRAVVVLLARVSPESAPWISLHMEARR